ncbi:retrotransposon ORF1 [Tanacetum coccineum]
MENENPIRTQGDYSRPSHEGYQNTIELPDGNNVVPLRSDTIRLVQMDAHSTVFGPRIQINILQKSLELGKNGSAFIQGEMLKRMKDPRLFTLPYRLGNSKAFDTLADLGSCVNLIPLYLFKKLKIGLLEETDHVFGLADGTKSYLVGIVKNVEVHIGRLKLLEDFYVIDMKKDPATPLLIGRGFLATASAVINLFRKMLEFLRAILINPKGNMWDSGVLVDKRVDWNKPPNREDGAWHIRIELNAFILA